MKKERTKKEKTPMSPQVKRTWISSVAAFVCVIIIAATLNSSAGKISDAIIKAADSAVPSSASEDAFAPDKSENTTAAIVDNSLARSQNTQTPSDATEAVSENAVAAEPAAKTTAEIVDIYNTAANKIKSNAKSITRNYSKMKSLPEYLQLPSAIESLGKWAIEKFVKGSDEPAYFTTKEEITAYFPVSGENYTTHLTADMVKSAVLKDNGTTYDITIALYNDKITSPKKGTGYAGVFNTVSALTFEDISIPGTKFESVKINGINGKIQCTVDKATGNITKIVFTNTDVLNLGVKVAGSNLDVKFALACENRYSIKY